MIQIVRLRVRVMMIAMMHRAVLWDVVRLEVVQTSLIDAMH